MSTKEFVLNFFHIWKYVLRSEFRIAEGEIFVWKSFRHFNHKIKVNIPNDYSDFGLQAKLIILKDINNFCDCISSINLNLETKSLS